MARPRAIRRPAFVRVDTQEEGLVVNTIPFFNPPKGLDLLNNIVLVEKEYARELLNLRVNRNTINSRPGVSAVGDPSISPVMNVYAYVNPSGSGRLFRFHAVSYDRWNGTAWVPTSAVFTNAINYEVTGWGYDMLVVNGSSKIFAINTLTGVEDFIEDSPSGAKHITSFGSRVVVSNIGTEVSKIQWCVNKDSEDWQGLGSGFENLFASAGGRVSEVHGVFPITDDTALVIRDDSTWQMSTTGDVDAPFRFTKLFAGIGTKYPRTIVETPYGWMMLGKHDVWLLNLNSPTPVGQMVRDDLLGDITDKEDVHAGYDAAKREYMIYNGTHVYRLDLETREWTRDSYPLELNHISRIEYDRLGLPIGDLTGNIGDLPINHGATIGDLVIAGDEDAMMFAAEGGQVLREDSAVTADVDAAGDPADSPIVLATGRINVDTVLYDSRMVELQIIYESVGAQDLIIEYSRDGGTTWTTYSTVTVAATSGPTILSVRGPEVDYSSQLRLRSTELGQLQIVSFVVHALRGEKESH